MIKNKDGSYNKFRLIIISLIFIIIISTIGIYISQNIKIPKIETPSWTTPTPTPTPTPTLPFPIDPKVAELYNGNSSNMTSWNWTYTNFTNVSNWTYPSDTNYTVVSNSSLIYYGGGGGGSSGYTNISYTVVAGGGGSGGMGYTGTVYTNSTYTGNVTTVHEVTPEMTYNLSQNISAAIGQPFAQFGITNPWLIIILFGMPFILFSRNSLSTLPLMFGFVAIGLFFKLELWTIIAMVMIIPFLITILSDR